VNEASEAAYERLTSELKSTVVAMWQELREKELQGKNARAPEENSESEPKTSALAKTSLH